MSAYFCVASTFARPLALRGLRFGFASAFASSLTLYCVALFHFLLDFYCVVLPPILPGMIIFHYLKRCLIFSCAVFAISLHFSLYIDVFGRVPLRYASHKPSRQIVWWQQKRL